MCCDINISLRSTLFAYLKEYVPLLQNLDTFNQLKHILNPIPELVCHIGVFIKQSLELTGVRSMSDKLMIVFYTSIYNLNS